MSQDLEVSPDVDFARLSEVLVVVAPAPPAGSRSGRAQGAFPQPRIGVYR